MVFLKKMDFQNMYRNYTNNQILSERRREDKGKPRDPFRVSKTHKKLERDPESGSWKVNKTTTTRMGTRAQIGRFKQDPTNLPVVQGGGHGGSEFGYGPHLHGKGGTHRGVKKRNQKDVEQRPPLNKHQRRLQLARKISSQSIEGHKGLTGDRAARRNLEKSKKSFGNWSRDMSPKNEQYDIYDIILSHLLDEGYAETPKSAEVIMVNMSEDWRYSILEGEEPIPYGRMMAKSDKLARSKNPKDQRRAAKIYLAANSPKGPKVRYRP